MPTSRAHNLQSNTPLAVELSTLGHHYSPLVSTLFVTTVHLTLAPHSHITLCAPNPWTISSHSTYHRRPLRRTTYRLALMRPCRNQRAFPSTTSTAAPLLDTSTASSHECSRCRTTSSTSPLYLYRGFCGQLVGKFCLDTSSDFAYSQECLSCLFIANLLYRLEVGKIRSRGSGRTGILHLYHILRAPALLICVIYSYYPLRTPTLLTYGRLSLLCLLRIPQLIVIQVRLLSLLALALHSRRE